MLAYYQYIDILSMGQQLECSPSPISKAAVELAHNIKCRGMDNANYVPCISLAGVLLQAPRRWLMIQWRSIVF